MFYGEIKLIGLYTDNFAGGQGSPTVETGGQSTAMLSQPYVFLFNSLLEVFLLTIQMYIISRQTGEIIAEMSKKHFYVFYSCHVFMFLTFAFIFSNMFEAPQRLRSGARHGLMVPRTRLRTIGDRAFGVAAARVWNSLLLIVTSASSMPSFKRQL